MIKLRCYFLIVLIVAIAASVYSAYSAPCKASLQVVAVLGALTFLTEWFAFKLPIAGSVSLAFATNLAALLLGGPSAGAMVAVLGAVSWQDVAEKKSPLRIAFNGAQLAISGIIGGTVFRFFDYAFPLHGALFPQVLLSLALASLALYAMNALLVGVAINISTGLSPIRIWVDNFSADLVSFGVLTLLGIVLAQSVSLIGPLAAGLLGIPFVLARQTFRVYLQLREALQAITRTLAEAVEAKDVYTRGHSERVAHYARVVCERLGKTEEYCRRVESAALLHDIGKIGVPSDTLNKRGLLTDLERADVQAHARLGADLLSGINAMRPIVPAIHHHHERLDGSGYPLRLPPEQIPSEARILAVADAFDAMTSQRSYRDAMSFEEAVKQIRLGMGTQFDREVAEVFLDAISAEVVVSLLEEYDGCS